VKLELVGFWRCVAPGHEVNKTKLAVVGFWRTQRWAKLPTKALIPYLSQSWGSFFSVSLIAQEAA
jgi:hypothetical protein